MISVPFSEAQCFGSAGWASGTAFVLVKKLSDEVIVHVVTCLEQVANDLHTIITISII